MLNKKISSRSYFHFHNFTLFHADSFRFLKKIPSESIDMIFADPPYHLSNGGITVHAGERVPVDKGVWDQSCGVKRDFKFHLKWLKECKRVLKPGSTIWVSGTYHSIYQCGYALQTLEYKILNDIVWYKPNASPNISCNCFTASHETILWARKDHTIRHTFNYKQMKTGCFPKDFIKKPNSQMRSVWAINTPGKKEKYFGKHPAQKSLELLERIVLSSSNEGDIILDPFTGSSTTGIAAIKHNRKYLGIDIDKGYLDLSIKRHKEYIHAK
jgi:site-specific DNA-methyltransferase (adenine-specific)